MKNCSLLLIYQLLLLLLCLVAFNQSEAQTTVWSKTVVDGSPAYGRGKAGLLMSNGDIVSACQITSGSATPANSRITRHAAATGNAVWTLDIDKGRSDDVNDMVSDSAGNIYLAYKASVLGSSIYHLNWYVIKVNGSTGAEVWTYTFAGASLDGNDEVFAISMCPDGNVVAVGNAEGGVRARAAKINASTGAQIWAFMEADSTTIRQLNCVTCDSTGSVYAGGQWAQADAYMVKLNGSTGALTWSKIINGPGGGIDSAQDVVVDSADNPIFCGNFPATAGNGDSFVIKLNPSTNAETWRSIFTGTAAAQDGAATVKVDASNDVYVAGFVRNTISATTDRNAYAAKLSGVDGSVTWSHTKNGTGALGTNSVDRYFSMVLANSSVYLCGTITNTTGDYLLTRLNASTGAEQWSFGYDIASGTEALFGGRRHLMVTGADEVAWVGETGATTGVVVKANPFSAPAPTTITSLNRVNPATSNLSTVNWTLTFAAANTGVTASNFSLSGAAATGATVGTPTTANSGLTWNVPVTTGSTDGTLTLSLSNATGTTPGISTTLPFAGQSYTMDKTLPTVLSIVRQTPTSQATTNTSLTFRVTFSEPINAPAASNFAIAAVSSSITGTIGTVTAVNSSTYDVPVTITGGSGEFRLKVQD